MRNLIFTSIFVMLSIGAFAQAPQSLSTWFVSPRTNLCPHEPIFYLLLPLLWRGLGWGHKKNKNSNYDHLKYSRKPLVNYITKVDKAITEYKELILIFVKSIETARKNKLGKNT